MALPSSFGRKDCCSCSSSARSDAQTRPGISPPQLRGAQLHHKPRRRKSQRSALNLDVQAVIPQLSGDATQQTPPDLPSYLFKERIVYLGMSLVPSVTELLLAEFLYLQYESNTAPIYMYINSAGVQKGGDKLGYESEAFAIYDTLRSIKPPVYTLCIGNAFGEAAMLLAAGEKGKRAALPSTSIMLRQPYQRFTQMQASDIDIYRNEIRKAKGQVVRILSRHTGHAEPEVEKDIVRTRYFDPYEAVDYGIIDRVMEPTDQALKVVAQEGSQLH